MKNYALRGKGRVVAAPFVLILALGHALVAQETGRMSIMQQVSSVRPFDQVTVVSPVPGTLEVKDSHDRVYVRMKIDRTARFEAGGASGVQTVVLHGPRGRAIDSTTFRVAAETQISDGGRISELFALLRNGMFANSPDGCENVSWHGKSYRFFVPWVLDNNNTMKGMKYFSPWGGDLVDLLREQQKPDGMIWSFVNGGGQDSSYYKTAYSFLGYFHNDNGVWFVRQPVENHVEYNFVNMMYQYWKASGNSEWMRTNLECACRALDYSMTDTLRWSQRFRLLKRPYCIDSWDFQVDDEFTPPAPLSPTMVVVPGKTKFGIFFGDNTGYFAACNHLAEMLEHAGKAKRATEYRQRGKEILERLVALTWNGKFFTHFVEEDSSVKRNLGVDEKTQIAQGNMYSLNRGLPREIDTAIIRTYLDLRSELPPGSPGEWYAIIPPFENGFGRHNEKWQYMNGGVAGHAIGELALGAYENGFEWYGSDIMFRTLELMKKYGNHLFFSYTGSIPAPPPSPHFKTVDLSGEANMDIWDKGGGKTFTWMDVEKGSGNDMRGLPTGSQVFRGIPFSVINPDFNDRRVVVAVSTKPGFPREIVIPVNDTAGSVYLLHSSSDNIPSHVGGALTFSYTDGTEASQYLFKGTDVTNWWFSTLDNERAGVAWSGPNPRSAKVGVCWAVIDNPNPKKRIRSLIVHAPLEGGIYALLGVTLADRAFFIPPKGESYGGPDNWAAATGMAAVIEGVAGVKNDGLAFSDVTLSPRWASAAVDSANAEVCFPASGGYVAYRYRHHPELREIDLQVTGSGDSIRGHLLLPTLATSVKSVSVDGHAVTFDTPRIGASRYVDFALTLPGCPIVKIRY